MRGQQFYVIARRHTDATKNNTLLDNQRADFCIRYLEYDERYNVGHNGGQIGNHQWAFN